MFYNVNTGRIDFVSYRSTIRNQSLRDMKLLVFYAMSPLLQTQ